MIGVVAKKEFTEIIRDGRFKYTAFIMALLLLTAFATGWQRYAAQEDMRGHAQETSNEQWLKQGDKNPHTAAHYGNYAFKPAGPLSYFDNGVENYTGTAVFMEAHKQNASFGRPASDQSAITRFGDLTGATILQILLPLFIIFLGFTAFSGERELGTLRQLMSVGVKKSDLLWGKALGISAAVALIVIPSIIIAALVLSSLGLASNEGFGPRVGVMTFGYVAYGLVFLFLTLAVSVYTKAARTTLIVLVGFWAFTGFLAPKAIAEISKAVYPTKTLGQFQADMKAHQARGFDGVSPWVRVEERKQELLEECGVDDVKQLCKYWVAERMQTLEVLDHKVFDFHYNELREGYVNQEKFQDSFGLIAPTLSIRSLSRGMAGTDLVTHIAFMEQAESFRRNMVELMNGYLSKAAVNLNSTFSASNYMTADEEVFSMVPPFEFEAPTTDVAVASQSANIVILLLWLLGAVAFARSAVNRLSVEV